ncbi:hypothetical protein OG21DRAFT_1518152 [Imleria badia]|nr:hypothetical protein OG21DRAFT_1518152 [Imleria badia]
MSSSLYQTVVVPVNLGEASSFNRAIFPLSSYQERGSLGRGDLYLDATLDEMLKIINIGANPQQWQELIATTKARYDQLMLQKLELERRPKSKNPFKFITNYRAARMFLAASRSLYFATKSRSEEMLRSLGRSLLSIPGEDVQPVNSEIHQGASIKGIAIKLNRPLDDTTRQQILDAANIFASCSGQFQGDQTISDASSFLSDEYVLASESLTSLVSDDTEETLNDATSPLPPSSPTIIKNYYNFYGSVYSPHSNVHGATVQLGGSSNSGSVTHTITPPNTT